MADTHLQRRLAAILAADAVGYSRLMGEDEEGTLLAFKAHLGQLIEPCIGEHSGRLIKTTGDGFLVEFASVVDAVRCALSIQNGMRVRNATVPGERRIQFRIGINLGDVIIQDDDIFGDGVNVATRLEGLAEPGGICLSRSARDQVRDRLEVALEDLGETRVKNIARPVRVFRVAAGTKGAIKPGRSPATARRHRFAVVAVAVSLLVGGAVWLAKPWTGEPSPPVGNPASIHPMAKPTVAVLPFENLSGDPTQDYFSDGLTEDIINALGRYRGLAVMAYNAALQFRGEAAMSQKIARALGVRYLVEGTVRRASEKVRISTRLIDTQNGVLVWSERFDSDNNDILAIQDAITRRVAGTLVSNLTRAEQERAIAKSTDNLGAYDLVLRGRAELRRATRRANRRARQMFERATRLDPDYGAAYAWLGRAYYQLATDGWTEFPARALERAEAFAQKALTHDGRSVEGLRTLARIHSLKFQMERALAEIDQAISINPSHAEALGDRGPILLWSGRLKEAVAAYEAAFSFDPNLRGDYVFGHGLAYYSLRRHADAIRVLERGAARYPDYVFIRVILVAAYGQLGRIAEARRNTEQVEKLLPIFDPAIFGSRFRDPALREYLAEGLRKGGLRSP